MHRAKRYVAAACLVAVSTTRLSAQGFDGVIQFVSYENESHPDTMTQITKGSKIRFEGLGEQDGAIIMDGNTSLILVTDQKMYMTLPPDLGSKEAADHGAKHHGVATKTGKMENIAGIPCEDWHYKGMDEDGKAEEGEVCIAKGAGLMINRLSGGIAAKFFTAAGQEFGDALKNGGGIMKVTNNGKLSLVAVKAKSTSVPDAMFVAPAGYTKLQIPGMGGPHKP
ncbi:MAG: DUF4412 domain-containing protein [Gemmatimonadaceae bacterium]|nr:DUF4412 domain-containing protein [Gemmatimonadaceae bacterium]